MSTVPHIMVGLERMLDYIGVGLARFHCIAFFLGDKCYADKANNKRAKKKFKN